jgi:hypothetical protein
MSMTARGRLITTLTLVASLSALAGQSGTARAAGPPPAATFTPNLDMGAGNEPQVTVDQSGRAFAAWQGPPGGKSTDDGVTTQNLSPLITAANGFSDTALATTTWPSANVKTPAGPANSGQNGLFFTILSTATACGAVANMRSATSQDQGASAVGVDATTCQPAQTDRNWTAAYTPPAFRNTVNAVKNTVVLNQYHDFGASNIWVVRSKDGGATYEVPQYSAIQPGSSAANEAGLATTACNTIPSGIAIAQRGGTTAHEGRTYVLWETSDQPVNLLTGCNVTQAQPFDHLFLSYSDDAVTGTPLVPPNWTSVNVFNDPCAPTPPAPPTTPTDCQDMSELFNSLAVDDAGNVYVGYIFRNIHTTPVEYDVYVSVSKDGGATWTQHKVNSNAGTHYMPWIAAGADGHIDVVYYETPPPDYGIGQFQKPHAQPRTAVWQVMMSQSVDGAATFTENLVSDASAASGGVYFGDICSTGIFCGLAPASFNWGQDRILFDDFGVAIGPDGGARVVWTDARNTHTGGCSPGGISPISCQGTDIFFACQASGVGLHDEIITGCGQTGGGTIAESRWAPGLLLAGGIAAVAIGYRRRQRLLAT